MEPRQPAKPLWRRHATGPIFAQALHTCYRPEPENANLRPLMVKLPNVWSPWLQVIEPDIPDQA